MKLRPLFFSVVGSLCLILAGFPLYLFPLAWVGVALLMEAWTKRRAAIWGLLAGVLYWSFNLFWIMGLRASAPVPAWLLGVGLALLVLAESLFWALLAWGTARWSQRPGRGWLIILAPALWVGLEWVKEHLGDLGFLWAPPWMPALGDPLMMRSAALWGPYTLGGIMLAGGVGLWLAVRGRSWRWALGFLGLLALPHLAGLLAPKPRESGRLRVLLLQPGVLPRTSHDPGEWRELARAYRALVAEAPKDSYDLVVMSESALMGYYRYSRRNKALVRELLAQLGAPAILGSADATRADGKTRLHNAALLVDTNGEVIGQYAKVKLVPFGEHLPFEGHLPEALRRVDLGQGDYEPGPGFEPIPLGHHKLGVLICYEAALVDPAREMAGRGAELLINITNDGWFGPGMGPLSHFAMARFRAVETGRYLVRVGKTGISGVVAPDGRVLAQIPAFTRGFMAEEVPLVSGETPYVATGEIWGPLGALIGLLALGYTLIPRRRR